MRVEVLIFFYIAVSIAMALFDLVFATFEHTRDKNFQKKTARIAEMLLEEIKRNSAFPTKEHMDSLERKMKKLPGLESFDLSMEKMLATNQASAEKYLLGISTVFENLVDTYAQKKPLNQAYYCYILKRWYRKRPASPKIVGLLTSFLSENTIYLCQNAFEALAALGDAELLAEAVVVLDNNEVFSHPKLITETVMAFSGDKIKLADALSERLDALSPISQAAVINFLRMQKCGKRKVILEKMNEADANTEMRIACVRYFMTNPWKKAKKPLLELASSHEGGDWEFASVAVSALAAYPGDDTVEVLKDALTSPTWYIRFNAAKSLYDLNVNPEQELKDIIEGSDRFAKEMISYRWNLEGHPLDLESITDLDSKTNLDSKTDSDSKTDLKNKTLKTEFYTLTIMPDCYLLEVK